ncbi:tyrosine-type recombinase/integrase [Kibdelosporangium phytohabitans]|uniref:Tyr recombinase domain-containing protein n=1 Tax=Kibdelosporangium phytohabitans TaxID=860235 RepID=A0A0N9HXA1_9PSEU|nr:tyrosine-type recombinase/integrase [Kibdelosporangium phytohabitans]ALG06809.1 hypothetical protein AOZ06_07605 [Kibdelosporangium phytohabitans]MBE1468051.1 integrase [Kibdelosporangium phytohabitans]
MARRPLPPGTHGEITATKIGAKRWEARCRFRQADGTYIRPRRVGTGKENAKENLREALVKLAEEVRGGEISRDSRMAHIYNLWAKDVDLRVETGDLKANSGYRYKLWVKNWVLPRVGQLTARELEASVMTCEKAIKNAEAKTSKATAGRVKVAFGLMCQFAVRHGAMTNNPVRSTDKVSQQRKKVVSLTVHQRRELLVKLDEFATKRQTNKRGRSVGTQGRVWKDMPDRFRAKLATGVRVGEIIALDGDSVDTRARTVRIDHHLVAEEGKGVVRTPGRKGDAPNLVLKYPGWSHETWLRLKIAAGSGPLFPNARGNWIHPTDAAEQESTALEACGFDWVTGHVIRKTVSVFLRSKGLSVEQIAAQLGNSVAVVKMYYLEEEVENHEQAEALEGMFDDEEDTG